MDETRESAPTEAPAPAAAAPAEAPPSPLGAFVGVIASPTATFTAMRGAKWHLSLWPLLALALLAAVATVVFMQRVDMDTFMRNQLKHSKFASQMSEAQVEQVLEGARDASPWGRAAMTAPITAVFILLVALVYWVCFLAMGYSVNYTQALLVASWAQVPKLIQTVLACGVFLARDPTDLDPQNPVLSNPGALMGQEALPAAAYALLSSLDLFAFWMMALYVIGFAAVGRMTKGQAAAVVIGIFLLKTALKAAWAFFFMA